MVPALFLVYLCAQKVDQIMYGMHGVGKLLKTSCCCQKAEKKSNKNWYFHRKLYTTKAKDKFGLFFMEPSSELKKVGMENSKNLLSHLKMCKKNPLKKIHLFH